MLFLFIPPSPKPLVTIDLLTISIVRSFSECHIVGVPQGVAFSDHILALSSIHLGFLLVLSWLHSSFDFSAELYSIIWMYHSLFILSPMKGIWVASKFWQL